jgi:uncharacterized membrane-anchored protein YjiN (DUF445 family)
VIEAHSRILTHPRRRPASAPRIAQNRRVTTTTVLPPDAPSPRDEGLSPADLVRRHELRRMKAVATGVLVVAFVVWVVCVRALAAGAPSWVGFVRAAAEAAMVGGLADWFAVTALFRHPLGIPIPHTALIPSRKEALGQSLSDFVGTHFLAEDVVRERVRRVGVAARVGDWLALPANASRVSAEVATAARAAVTVLDDSDVQAVLEDTVLRRLTALPVGPPLGALLEGVVRDGSHRATVDLLVDHLRVWLADHREDVVEAVAAAAPGWSPRVVDEAVGIKVHTELLRIAAEVRADPQHPLRLTIDRALVQFADDLRHDPATQARVQAAKDRLLSREETRAAVADLAASARRVLTESLADPDSELRRRLTAPWATSAGGCSAMLRAGPRSTSGSRTPRPTSSPRVPRRAHPHHHGDRRALGRPRDGPSGRARGRARPAVHPHQRGCRGGSGGAGHPRRRRVPGLRRACRAAMGQDGPVSQPPPDAPRAIDDTPNAPPSMKLDKRKSIIAGLVAIVFLVVVFVTVIPKFGSYAEAWTAIQAMPPGSIATLVGALLIYLFFYGWPFVASVPGLRYWQGQIVNESAFTISNGVPAGGALGLGCSTPSSRRTAPRPPSPPRASRPRAC